MINWYVKMYMQIKSLKLTVGLQTNTPHGIIQLRTSQRNEHLCMIKHSLLIMCLNILIGGTLQIRL